MFGLFKKPAQDFAAEIRPAGTSLQVKAGDNLLKAALEAGLAWPHDCRVGSCGSCRCKLIDGRIKRLADFSYVLTGEELQEGTILACQTSLRSDVIVEVGLEEDVTPTRGVTTLPGVIAASRQLTHDIIELEVRLEQPWSGNDPANGGGGAYLAGQYAELAVPGIDPPRAYSFATAPHADQKTVSFFIRLVPGGQMTGWLFEQDRTGTPVTVKGPYGSFWLREGEGPILCVAGGSGMSAIKALLEDAAEHGCTRDAVYVFGARTQSDLYCLDAMDSLTEQWRANGAEFRFVPVLSEEPDDSDWTGLRGLCTEHIKSQGLDLDACQAYLCGPPPMIDSAIDVLHRTGVTDERIFFDKFLDASNMPGGRQ